MKDLLKNIADLIKVKTIITVVMLCVYAYLAISGTIKADSVETLLLMVISFYFGTQIDKKREGNS